MTDPPGPVRPVDPAAHGGTVAGEEAGAEERTDPPALRRRRVRRRAERPGTNPSADDAPDVVAPREDAQPGESQHDRWLREQRPPHWE